MGERQMVSHQLRTPQIGLVLGLAAAALFAATMGCKKGGAPPEPSPKPRATVAAAPGGTSQTLAALRLYAEVPKFLAPRVIANAKQAFAGVKEAEALWPTPEGKALAYHHSTDLLAALARADRLTSDPTVLEVQQQILYDEYRARLYQRQTGEIPVTNKEVEDFYKANLSQYVVKGQFWIRHIFLNVVDNPGKGKEKEALAQKALAEIKAGKPFQEVAKKYSDAEQEKGDIVGPLPYGDINPDLEKAIAALTPGQNTDVLSSKWGYNIFRLEQIARPTTRSLEMVHDSIVQQMRRQKSRTAFERFLQQMEQNYPVTKHYEVLKDPNVSSDTVVVEGIFVKMTVGDYRREIAHMTAQRRAAMNDPANRTDFLDGWVAWKRIEHAAIEAGLNRDPEIQSMKDYMTNWTLSMAVLDELTAKLPPPDEATTRKFYDENRSIFLSKQAEVRVRELVLSYKQAEGTSRRDYYLARKKAQALAEEILAKLKAGADFVELVKQSSNSETAKMGGDLGFMPPERWGKELADAVANLKPGEWTQALERGEAFTIFRLEERKPEEYAPYDTARKQYISELLTNQRRNEISARIRMKLAQAYRKDMPVEEIRKIANEER